MVRSIGRLLELLNLGLEVLEVLLFPFPEGTLCGTILRLALLQLC